MPRVEMTHRQRQNRRRRSRPRFRHRFLLSVALLVAVGVIAGLSLVGYIVAIAASAPNINQLKPIDQGASSEIFAADGSSLGYVQSLVVRTPAHWADIPVNLRRATIAIEDKRFYEHGGVDYEGIFRAAVKNLQSGKTLQGGSTITQQLVRALYIQSPKRDFKRKIREAKMASELEKQQTKTWILGQYLNDVPYGTVGGRTAIGVEAAAETYFGKHVKDLTLPESALLAGLPQAPSLYNPIQNPSGALQRRNEVLQSMAASHYISEADATEASTAPLGLRPGKLYFRRREPYFFDYVQEQVIEHYGAGVYKKGGLKIYTTIDPRLQDAARKAIRTNLYAPDDPSSAIVSIDPATGYIRAMASSGNYGSRNFNLASQGQRQPGSAFKTMVLATAIREGMDPNSTVYVSKPLTLFLPKYGAWKVKTYGDTYGGPMTVTEATLKSDNTVYAQLDLDVGPKKVAETAHMMGITSHLDGYPGEGLGGLRLGVSPLEIADAYATLSAGGIHSQPQAIRRVVFSGGKADDIGKPRRNRVFSDGVAQAVTQVLEQNIQRGTATAAGYGCPAAAKTGTTDNFKDAWLVGYTPKLATSVWVGYPTPREMRSVHGISVAGGTIPAQIWHDYMSVGNSTCGSFPSATQPVQFNAFYGAHSANGMRPYGRYYGGYRSSRYRSGTSFRGGTSRSYDPRLYAGPRQGPPRGVPPAPPTTGGGGGTAGGGPGGGPATGGTPPAPPH
ncbi:MAG: PBP1A family penicillin-binding protein [Thermoleophilaceae bacterium]